jgi:flagellar hook-associated protein 3 FlgL
MSGTINLPSEGALLARLADNGATIRRQLDTATTQASTGRIAESYAGLGFGAKTSLDLRPQVTHAAAWQANIDGATGRLGVAQSALSSISAIAADFFAKAGTLNGLVPSEADSIAAAAHVALQQVSQLLNSKAGDTYVFAGQDTGNPPIPDTSVSAVSRAVLASDTAAAPFSASLGAVAPTVEVGEGQRVQVGLLANSNTLVASAAPTTGSYMRDILRALATLTTATVGPGLQALAADTRARLGSAVGAIAVESGALGDVQSSMAARRTQLGETVTALNAQVSGAEDVDLAATLTRVSLLQSQLQVSYRLIAGVKDLSLAQYL